MYFLGFVNLNFNDYLSWAVDEHNPCSSLSLPTRFWAPCCVLSRLALCPHPPLPVLELHIWACRHDCKYLIFIPHDFVRVHLEPRRKWLSRIELHKKWNVKLHSQIAFPRFFFFLEEISSQSFWRIKVKFEIIFYSWTYYFLGFYWTSACTLLCYQWSMHPKHIHSNFKIWPGFLCSNQDKLFLKAGSWGSLEWPHTWPTKETKLGRGGICAPQILIWDPLSGPSCCEVQSQCERQFLKLLRPIPVEFRDSTLHPVL